MARPFIFKAFFWTNVLRSGTRGKAVIFKALINRLAQLSLAGRPAVGPEAEFFEAIEAEQPSGQSNYCVKILIFVKFI